MRFVVDECLGAAVVRWLDGEGHDVVSVYEATRGALDEDILALAVRDDRIVITADKDFGDLVFRDQYPHRGVILLRLDDETSRNVIRVLAGLLALYADEVDHNFAVVTETSVRISRATS